MMQNKESTTVILKFFTVFPEYLISISAIYLLIVIVLITYNTYGLMLQKALSECLALMLLMTCYLLLNDDLIASNFLTFNNSIINDYFAYVTKSIVGFASAVYFLIISDSLKDQRLTSFEYLLLTLFAVLGLMLLCSSNDFLTVYLAVELSSLSFYILAAFKKTSSYSIDSGIKYFITGAVSSAFFLLGSSFIYGVSGSINFYDFSKLYSFSKDDIISFSVNLELYFYVCNFLFNFAIADVTCYGFEIWYFDTMFLEYPRIYYDALPLSETAKLAYYYAFVLTHVEKILDALIFYYQYSQTSAGQLSETCHYLSTSFVELGLTFILISLFIKLALAPFHLWSLDVYEGSPTSATFFFAVISKLSIFVLLVRLCYGSFYYNINCWQFYTLIVGFFSVFVGSFGGLIQRKLKTLLAYSSTSHMGYSLISFSTGTLLGVQMMFVYLFIYMIAGLATWAILLSLKLRNKNLRNKYSKELGDITLLKKSNSALAFAFALTMFSVAGIPPMVGFLAKMSIFLSVIGISFYLLALFTILLSVVSTFYYIRIIKIIYFENSLVGNLYYPINKNQALILSGLIFLLILLFINPTLLYLLSYKAIFFTFAN